MKPNPVRRVRWRKALRPTAREVGYLLPLAVVYWAVTGATMRSAAWAAFWLILLAVGYFAINCQRERLRSRPQTPTVRRRQPQLRVAKIAGASSRAAQSHDA